MVEEYAKNNTMTSKRADPITEFSYEGIDSRLKDTVIKTLMMKHEELVAKEEALEEATNTVAILKAENYELRRAVDSLKTQNEAKLDEIKTLISHGLESENDAKENIKLGLKIIDEKKVDVKVLTREWIKVDKSRPKLDSNTPSSSGKDGERLDEWLFVMNTAFESLKVMGGKERCGV
jgi:hypothetical protein